MNTTEKIQKLTSLRNNAIFASQTFLENMALHMGGTYMITNNSTSTSSLLNLAHLLEENLVIKIPDPKLDKYVITIKGYNKLIDNLESDQKDSWRTKNKPNPINFNFH